MFEVVLFDENAKRNNLGFVRIMEYNLTAGYVQLKNEFTELDENFCSLGNDRRYYVELAKLPMALRRHYLNDMRDCVAHPEIFDRFLQQPAMRTSLLRDASPTDVRHNYPRILHGDLSLTPYRFSFIFQTNGGGSIERCFRGEAEFTSSLQYTCTDRSKRRWQDPPSGRDGRCLNGE